MVRGQADYGALAAKETTASVSDMGEVAARLGSIVTYDKRGDVIDFDNFEEPILKWNSTVISEDGAIYLDSENAKSGSQTVKLATGYGVDDYVLIEKYLSVLGSKQLGLEVSWSHLTSQTILYIALVFYTGALELRAEVKLDLYTKKLYIYVSFDNYKEIISGIDIPDVTFAFETLKIVADFDTKYWKRLLFGHTEYDLSSEALGEVSNYTTSRIDTEAWIANWGTTPGYVWIDDIIWTQAEP